MQDKSAASHPPWLKAMQNGAIGEARTRAFLLDRFWVLERSADVDGADFIIQRRITGKNLLDRQAPRLGVVQVKFFGTETTHHFVHKEYVLDDHGDPREEFFLLCHIGQEDQSRVYIVSGRELHESFSTITKKGHEGYAIPYDQLTSSGRFEVVDRKRTLDRIERQLELAEFTKNRRFLSWALPSASEELAAIAPLYREPIENWWGDIPEGFMGIKSTARRAMLDVEEIYHLLHEITEQTDPLAVEEMIDRIAYNCRDGFSKWSISLPDLHDDEFFRVCHTHKKIVEQLRLDGLLDSFLKVRGDIHDAVVAFLEPHLPVDPNILHCFSVFYDPDTFAVSNISSTLEDAAAYLGLPPTLDRFGHVNVDSFRYQVVEKAVPGQIDCYWLPGRYGNPTGKPGSLIETYRDGDFRFYYDCLNAMFTLKYGDDFAL